jgi:hypothetical protein
MPDRRRSSPRCVALWCFGAALMVASATLAQDSGNYFDNYFKVVDKTQAEQPHWITPLITVTPRLEEEVRYDFNWQSRNGGVTLDNTGVGKGLEAIPFEPIEVIIGIPAYENLDRPGKPSETGWADETFLLKCRLFTGNEENGNFIVTAFLGVSVPSGSPSFTQNETIYTPTLAFGKGWGTRSMGFDVQSTIAISLPNADVTKLGEPIVWNTAFQAHVLSEVFWPEIEVNYTHFKDGPNDGRDQVILTSGFVLGRFPIYQRLRGVVGLGHQDAVSGFHTFNHAWVLSLRAPF